MGEGACPERKVPLAEAGGESQAQWTPRTLTLQTPRTFPSKPLCLLAGPAPPESPLGGQVENGRGG